MQIVAGHLSHRSYHLEELSLSLFNVTLSPPYGAVASSITYKASHEAHNKSSVVVSNCMTLFPRWNF